MGKLYGSNQINRSKINSSILNYSEGRVKFAVAKSENLNFKLVSIIYFYLAKINELHLGVHYSLINLLYFFTPALM